MEPFEGFHDLIWAGTTPGNNEAAGKGSRAGHGRETRYDDPGADYFTRLNPGRARNEPSTDSRPWATASS
jgi:hypothetical protein